MFRNSIASRVRLPEFYKSCLVALFLLVAFRFSPDSHFSQSALKVGDKVDPKAKLKQKCLVVVACP